MTILWQTRTITPIWTCVAPQWQTDDQPFPIHEARMPNYDYDCGRCGPFRESHPMAEFELPQSCPACGDAAPRALTSPAIGGGSPAFRRMSR